MKGSKVLPASFRNISRRLSFDAYFIVAITALFVDNSFVILGSLLLSFNLIYKDDILPLWSGYLQSVLFAGIIICAVINNLGSMASTIVIERDWIVVLSDGNEEQLSRKCLFISNFLSNFIFYYRIELDDEIH